MKSMNAIALALTALFNVVPSSLADSEAQMQGGREATTENSSSAGSQHSSQAQTQNTSHASRHSSSSASRHSGGPRVVNNVSRRPNVQIKKIETGKKLKRTGA